MGIFDRLGFVEDDVVEFDVFEKGGVAAEGAVGGDDQIIVGEMVGGFEAIDAGVVENPQCGGEAFGFFLPVEDEGFGDDDEGRVQGSGFRVQEFTGGEEGEDLHGFAEAHVIGEAAAEAEAFQESEPAQAIFLVGAELADEVFGGFDGRYAFEAA